MGDKSELIRSLSLNALNIDDYEGEEFNTYKYFEQEFERLLEINSEIYKMDSVLFYIKNSVKCNAFARKIGCHNVIGITQGYPILIGDKFKENLFKNVIFAAFFNNKEVSDGFAALYENKDFSFGKYMLDCSIQFTFYHEFRHLRQFNAFDSQQDIYLNENLSTRPFDLNKHILEYDADKSAANDIVRYASSIRRQLGLRADGEFLALIYCALGSLFVTRALFNYGLVEQWQEPFNLHSTEFYTKENWHPHPSIRAINLLDSFNVYIEDGYPHLKVDTQDLVTNSLGIAKLYIEQLLPHVDAGKLIFRDMFSEIEKSNEYNDYLHSEALKHPIIKKLIGQ